MPRGSSVVDATRSSAFLLWLRLGTGVTGCSLGAAFEAGLIFLCEFLCFHLFLVQGRAVCR